VRRHRFKDAAFEDLRSLGLNKSGTVDRLADDSGGIHAFDGTGDSQSGNSGLMPYGGGEDGVDPCGCQEWAGGIMNGDVFGIGVQQLQAVADAFGPTGTSGCQLHIHEGEVWPIGFAEPGEVIGGDDEYDLADVAASHEVFGGPYPDGPSPEVEERLFLLESGHAAAAAGRRDDN